MPNEKIDYHGKKLALGAIAKKEGLTDVTLARYYKNIGDIYKAVKLCKKATRGKVQKIEYYGEMLAISVIAKREEVGITKLTECYHEIGNIYEAVSICKQKKQQRAERKIEIEENEKEEYYGEKLRLREIAQKEEVEISNLRKCLKETDDIYKAIFMAKQQKQKQRIVNYPAITVNLYDVSLLVGVDYMNLMNLLSEGKTIAQVKVKYANENPGEAIKLPNGQSLLGFCMINRINFTYMYRAIRTYGKSYQEAVEQYNPENIRIPTSWILEKYGVFLEKIATQGTQQLLFIKDMSEKQLSFREVLEKNIIRKNALKNGISIEWGETLYSISKTRELLGGEFHEEIKINEKEKVFLEECMAQIRTQGTTNPNDNIQEEQEL